MSSIGKVYSVSTVKSSQPNFFYDDPLWGPATDDGHDHQRVDLFFFFFVARDELDRFVFYTCSAYFFTASSSKKKVCPFLSKVAFRGLSNGCNWLYLLIVPEPSAYSTLISNQFCGQN